MFERSTPSACRSGTDRSNRTACKFIMKDRSGCFAFFTTRDWPPLGISIFSRWAAERAGIFDASPILGRNPRRCFGIDLYQKSLREAWRVNPNISFAEANAAQLPFADNTFDLAFQFTVMTSVLDTEVRQEIASEIRRVLRTGSYLVWYDFAYSNPRNPTVRGISRNEIRDLLPGFRLQFNKITLAPPIGRPAAKVSPTLYRILSSIPLLRTHYFCFAQKI